MYLWNLCEECAKPYIKDPNLQVCPGIDNKGKNVYIITMRRKEVDELFQQAIGAYEASQKAAEEQNEKHLEDRRVEIINVWKDMFGVEPDSVSETEPIVYHGDRTFKADLSYDYIAEEPALADDYHNIQPRTRSVGGTNGLYFRMANDRGQWSTPIDDLETLGRQLVNFRPDAEEIPF